jgi:hypothetical protein
MEASQDCRCRMDPVSAGRRGRWRPAGRHRSFRSQWIALERLLDDADRFRGIFYQPYRGRRCHHEVPRCSPQRNDNGNSSLLRLSIRVDHRDVSSLHRVQNHRSGRGVQKTHLPTGIEPVSTNFKRAGHAVAADSDLKIVASYCLAGSLSNEVTGIDDRFVVIDRSFVLKIDKHPSGDLGTILIPADNNRQTPDWDSGTQSSCPPLVAGCHLSRRRISYPRRPPPSNASLAQSLHALIAQAAPQQAKHRHEAKKLRMERQLPSRSPLRQSD